MPDTLTRQIEWAKQQTQHRRSQVAQTVGADQHFAARIANTDQQLRALVRNRVEATDATHSDTGPFQDIENFRRFLMEKRQHLQSLRQQLAKQLAAQRAERLRCEQRLRLLERRQRQRQQHHQRRRMQSQTELLDRFSRECMQTDMLSREQR